MEALIFIATCITMIIFVLTKPKITLGKLHLNSYWVITLSGAVLMLLIKHKDVGIIAKSLLSDSAVNPIKILTLFLSMTFISVFLDVTGLFSYLAGTVLKSAGKNQFKLFFFLYITVSVLTVFTSNDIIILTFTPFICYFCKRANISPVPYLFAEFVAANTWSMFLIIGNPTNIYIASYFGTDFLTYIKEMAVPTVFSGVTSFVILFMLFKKQLSINITPEETPVSPIKFKALLIIGVIHLAVCTVILSVCSYIGLEMWYISLASALSLCVCTLVYCIIKRKSPLILLMAAERIPFQLIPFVISMFVLVLELEISGTAELIGRFLSFGNEAAVYTFASAISSNILNNIPMSVLFGSVINASGAGVLAQYGSIIGSNLGALITPIGALAGIMWTDILATHGVEMSAGTFVKYGCTVAFPALIASGISLYLF